MAKAKVPDKGKDLILIIGTVIIFAVLLWIISTGGGNPHPETNATAAAPTTTLTPEVRPAAVAGQFYPKDGKTLSDDIDKYLSQAAANPDVWGVRGLISPHAGYEYSGPVAAYGYKQLIGSRYETVIILGPSHHAYLKKAYIPDVDYYETPLGKVPISPKVKDMLKEGVFTSEPAGADSQEHSIEVQVPFLQKVLPPFKLVPIMVGDVDPKELAAALSKYADNDTLIIASSDLSHYKPYDECVATDNKTVDSILWMDYDAMSSEGDACGKIPILALMELAQERGWRTQLFDYRNSGDTTGVKDQGVVGYSSIGFLDGLNSDEKRMLLKLAKDTLTHYFDGTEMVVDDDALSAKLHEEKGCFVTLNEDKQLRGCIGHLSAQEKLYGCVIDNALNAAFRDGRFQPVGASELPNIKLEISVLTEPKPLKYASPEDLKAKLIPGVDGVILKSDGRESTFLPVVWDMLPNKEEFLSELCLKQGSPANCWKTAEVLTYQAQEFHEDGFK
jgi:MEMO1 family protein